MSLVFGAATSHRVDHGTLDGVNWDQITFLIWFYLTSFVTEKMLLSRILGGSGVEIQLSSDAGPSALALVWSGSVSNAIADAQTTMTTGKWWFAAATADRTLTAPSVQLHIYVGDLATLAVEDTYTSNDNGAGLHDIGARACIVGNAGDAIQSLPGSIAVASVVGNRVLTLAEIQRFQFAPRKYWAEQQVFSRLGMNGTTNVPDLSGNGNVGTITGATLGDDVPLPPWFGVEAALVSAAAAKKRFFLSPN